MRCCIVLLSVVSAVVAARYRKNLVFSLGPGDSTCFIKSVLSNKVIEIVYKVIESTTEDACISFELLAPRGRGSALRTRRWPAGAHVLHAALPGSYRFCFDNSHDHVGKKTIFFDINIRPKARKPKAIHGDITLVNPNVSDETLSPEEAEELSLQQFGPSRLVSRYQDVNLDVDNTPPRKVPPEYTRISDDTLVAFRYFV